MDPVRVTPDDPAEIGPRSSVKIDINAKGMAQPKVSVYEGTSEEEMQRLLDLAVRTVETTIRRLGNMANFS